MLFEIGIVKGDVGKVYLLMVPQTVIAMLAIVRMGAVHSVVFGGCAIPHAI